MGFNVCCIGSSDYSTKMYSYDEGDPDPELKRFSIAQDRLYLLPILHEARKANPENSASPKRQRCGWERCKQILKWARNPWQRGYGQEKCEFGEFGNASEKLCEFC